MKSFIKPSTRMTLLKSTKIEVHESLLEEYGYQSEQSDYSYQSRKSSAFQLDRLFSVIHKN